MQSYLNLIEIDTARQLRLAQFGFHATLPSFVEGGISFFADGRWKLFSLDTGMVCDYTGDLPARQEVARLEFTTPLTDGVGYCRLIVGSHVVNNFMGGDGSIGAAPISPDGKYAVYIGYPSKEGFGA